ncbi:MAG: hypothetical protein J6W16_07205 [Methanobrevibacter sp.]|nr:hypothetical protein [Methanobrevibacter sp.]MBP5785351.1 hypothetical protein [Methanobrevibacter sp.]
MFTWNKKKAKEASPLGEMIADRVDALSPETIARLNKLSNLDPLLNIAAGKEIKIDSSTGAVSVGDKS